MKTLSMACLAATLIAWPASAQPEGLGGNPIPGLCMISREAIFANAKAGVAATSRLKQIADAAQAEIDAERKPVDADLKAFQAEAAKLNADQRRVREQALAARLQPIQDKAQLRSREVDATRAKALERISAAAQPVIAEAYRKRGCGLLVDRATVLGGNMTNDLTATVVQALDVQMPTISFERETLRAQ